MGGRVISYFFFFLPSFLPFFPFLFSLSFSFFFVVPPIKMNKAAVQPRLGRKWVGTRTAYGGGCGEAAFRLRVGCGEVFG